MKRLSDEVKRHQYDIASAHSSQCFSNHLIRQILAPSNYHLFPNLKTWFGRQKFNSNEEVISAKNVYYEEADESHYKVISLHCSTVMKNVLVFVQIMLKNKSKKNCSFLYQVAKFSHRPRILRNKCNWNFFATLDKSHGHQRKTICMILNKRVVAITIWREYKLLDYTF